MLSRRALWQAASGAAIASGQTGQPKRAKITSSVMLWTLQGSFEQKVEIAARAGLQSIELVDEHVNWTEAEIRTKRRFVQSFNFGMETIIATPNWSGRPVSMVDPAQRDNFLADVKSAIEWARKLETPYIILMSGNAIPGRTYEQQYASLVEGAKRAAELARGTNVTLIVEPLNSKVDHKGYFLTTCKEGLRLVTEVNSPNFKLLFDIYHEQVQAGDVTRTLKDAAAHVALFHVADNPGRNDPGTGELNYSSIYRAIQEAGYSGSICMEYRPLHDPVESLKRAVDQMRASFRER